jgi:hypothetical protein
MSGFFIHKILSTIGIQDFAPLKDWLVFPHLE